MDSAAWLSLNPIGKEAAKSVHVRLANSRRDPLQNIIWIAIITAITKRGKSMTTNTYGVCGI
jgi:hypothetical protein